MEESKGPLGARRSQSRSLEGSELRRKRVRKSHQGRHNARRSEKSGLQCVQHGWTVGTFMGRVTGDGVKEASRTKPQRVFVLRGVDCNLDIVRSHLGGEVSK